jgi:hypothetical protein
MLVLSQMLRISASDLQLARPGSAVNAKVTIAERLGEVGYGNAELMDPHSCSPVGHRTSSN